MKMKKIKLAILAMAMPLMALAQGWPANYGGVMLQGFYWDSYTETKWSVLTSQADELSKYYNLIWVPQSGNCQAPTWATPLSGGSTRAVRLAPKANCAP